MKNKKEEKKWAERRNLNLKSIYELEALKVKIEKTFLYPILLILCNSTSFYRKLTK